MTENTATPAFQIEEGDVPATVSTRTARPNPFVGKFPTPTDENGKPTRSMVVTLPSGTKEEKAEVNTVANMAQKAARDAGFTGRIKREEVKVGNKVHTRLTIWSTPAIKHAPMSEEKKAERAAKRRATLAAKAAAKGSK